MCLILSPLGTLMHARQLNHMESRLDVDASMGRESVLAVVAWAQVFTKHKKTCPLAFHQSDILEDLPALRIAVVSRLRRIARIRFELCGGRGLSLLIRVNICNECIAVSIHKVHPRGLPLRRFFGCFQPGQKVNAVSSFQM